MERWNSGTVDRGISEDAEWRNILKRRMPFCLEQKSQKIKSHKKGTLFIISKQNWKELNTYKRKIIYHGQEKLKEA